MKVLKNILTGMVLGISNIIPGVSAGTMAVIMDIYDEFIGLMGLNKKVIRENWHTFAAWVAGILLSLLAFSSLISFLLEHYRMPTMYFFMGLVVGGVPPIWHRAKSHAFKVTNLAAFVLALVLMLLTVVFEPKGANPTIDTLTSGVFFYLVATMAVSAVAMVIPGISGSFIALVLGAYTTVITSISRFNFPLLVPIGIGVLLGLLGGARLVAFLMKRYPQTTYMAILGLVVGSLFSLYPGYALGLKALISLAALAAGVALPMLSERLGRKKA